VREKWYSYRKQLNYVSAEEAMPGDILVFDAGGDTRSAVSGDVTTLRFLVRGGAGMVIDGAMRDLPELAGMPFQVYTRRGQAAAVSPVLMSIDYQVPVRIGNVTVIPGDILLGERHGILVIPAAIADEVVDAALAKSELEEFQRKLLLEGRSIDGVYPPNEETLREFELSKGAR
jgi:regulator of RNase E activity RraA